jgi:hypothetical protein
MPDMIIASDLISYYPRTLSLPFSKREKRRMLGHQHAQHEQVAGIAFFE